MAGFKAQSPGALGTDSSRVNGLLSLSSVSKIPILGQLSVRTFTNWGFSSAASSGTLVTIKLSLHKHCWKWSRRFSIVIIFTKTYYQGSSKSIPRVVQSLKFPPSIVIKLSADALSGVIRFKRRASKCYRLEPRNSPRSWRIIYRHPHITSAHFRGIFTTILLLSQLVIPYFTKSACFQTYFFFLVQTYHQHLLRYLYHLLLHYPDNYLSQ